MLGALYSNRSGLLLLVLGSLDAQRVAVRSDPVERILKSNLYEPIGG
jgi:energy-converting hydrogenase Eha subunit E